MDRVVVGGRYELDTYPLGHGGMGQVFGGYDRDLDRRIAVKFVILMGFGSDPELIERFKREARLTAALEHPGVPAVYDFGQHTDGRYYLVMQLVPGLTVQELIDEEGRVPESWVAAIGAQVCAVLAVAHDKSLVHRDLKPANLMLCPDGSVKVLDFGLALGPATGNSGSRLTLPMSTPGTPAYTPPELTTARISSPKGDLYSLGCTLYAMLSGNPPFEGPTPYAVADKHCNEDPAPLSLDQEGLAEVVMRLLEKNPEHRPIDATEVHRALLPFAVDLPPLPGIELVSPLRMYTSVLGGTFPLDVGARQLRKRREPHVPVTEDGIVRALEEAENLGRKSRYRQASDVLAAIVEPAGVLLGEDAELVVDLRIRLADLLFEAGDYRQAIPALRTATKARSDRLGPEHETVRLCRHREVVCHRELGQTRSAISLLDLMVKEEERRSGGSSSAVAELREERDQLLLALGELPSAPGFSS